MPRDALRLRDRPRTRGRPLRRRDRRGADCSNLLIHAWRRQGLPLDWGDPGILRRQLATKAGDAEKAGLEKRIPITPEEVEAGLAIDFGRHVAAVWEDREPFGTLGPEDLVLHHLGGFPEIVALGELAATRPDFAVLAPRPRSGLRVAFAGDVVLAGDDPVALPGFGRGEADLFLVNLEGIPSVREPETAPRYDFRFPPERLGFLSERGVDGVSLANNHALDAGPTGLIEGLNRLRSAGLPCWSQGCRFRCYQSRGTALRCETEGTMRRQFVLAGLGKQDRSAPNELSPSAMNRHRGLPAS